MSAPAVPAIIGQKEIINTAQPIAKLVKEFESEIPPGAMALQVYHVNAGGELRFGLLQPLPGYGMVSRNSLCAMDEDRRKVAERMKELGYTKIVTGSNPHQRFYI